MPNDYFQFKQFTIHQDQCAMKVCTDACLFGAMIPPNPLKGEFAVLDIGTGTGLLSLIYAQKDPLAIIDAVEIDPRSAQQANDNFTASPWKERLNIINADIKNFSSDKKYDCIISNPPFFENDLRSVDAAKNRAKHEGSLGLQELLAISFAYLDDDGLFAVLVPFHRVEDCEGMAAAENLYPFKKILVRQTTSHDYFRGILFFSKAKTEVLTEEISIKNEEGNYTEAFIALLKDYYLYL